MDAIREQLNKPVIVGVVGLIVGVLLGVLYAWQINPVQWTDADVTHLRQDLQADYLRMAIEAYSQNRNADLARQRFTELGEDGEALLEIAASGGVLNEQAINDYRIAVLGTPTATEEVAAEEAGGEAAPPGRGFLGTFLMVLCGLVLLVALAGGGYYLYTTRFRNGGPVAATPAVQAQEAARQAEWTNYTATGEEPPMAQFMASYKVGDDLFDDSFSIDSQAGEFLGECGVGISETIGVGEPKRVTAFEIWLFDKDDIQTVTKVFMSAHAFLDESTRGRLAAKGEPVLTEAGTETILETKTLRMVARVIDMGYGDGALPEHSFFDRLVLELAIWSKS